MKTPLFPIYERYQGKVIDFHGWNLPVQFNGIIQEHLTVRNQVGLFDVSHMGEFLVTGAQAVDFLEAALTNRIGTLQPGVIRYSPLCYENGGTVDDLLVYCLSSTEFLLVVNASNIPKDFAYLQSLTPGYQVQLEDRSAETAQIAVQGPLAQPLLQKIFGVSLDPLRYYHFIPEIKLDQVPVLLSRTGYTGEDGFELYLRPHHATLIWEILMAEGAPLGIQPIGLGARDTLRFEAGLPLYGQELSETISPLEAGLGRFVKFDKPHFVGKSALWEQQQRGLARILTGLTMIERGIPRPDYQVLADGSVIGWVTSGSFAPSLNQNLAMVLIDSAFNQPEAAVQVEIRGKRLAAKLTAPPFYTRPTKQRKETNG